MHVVLDPNIITTAFRVEDNYELLQFLGLNCHTDAIKICRDTADQFLSSIKRYLELKDMDNPTIEVAFIGRLIDHWYGWTEGCDLSEEALTFLDEHDSWCRNAEDVDFPNEFQLLALAHGKGRMLSISPQFEFEEFIVRERLYDDEYLSQVGDEKLPGIDVKDSSSSLGVLDSGYSSKLFENKVKEWLDEEQEFETIPEYYPNWLKDAPGGGRIDVYAARYRKNHRPSSIAVCECKLKLRGRAITKRNMEQLLSTWEAVRDYEVAKANREGYSVSVEPWIITNVRQFTPQALALAKENSKFKYYHVSLPTGWRRHSYWKFKQVARWKYWK